MPKSSEEVSIVRVISAFKLRIYRFAMEKKKVSREVTESDINCLENLVVAYNTVFLMSSIFVVLIASTTRDLFYDYGRVISPWVLLLIVGGFIVFLAGIGYVGVGKKSSSLMSAYTMLLIFVFAMEISAGLGVLSFRKEIRSMASYKMKKAISAYPNDPMTANLVDYVQLQLRCCGVNGFKDWDEILGHHYESTCKIADLTLPPSCCSPAGNSSLTSVNLRGCLPAVNFMIHRSALALTTAVIAICTVQILGAYFSYSLASSLSKYKRQKAIQAENSMSVNDIGIPMSYNEKNNYY